MSKNFKNTSINRQIASIHLTAKIWQTVVAVLGVTFGVSMYIFMNSFMNGVNSAQDSLAFSTLGHVRVYNDDHTNPYDPAKVIASSENTILHLRNKKAIQYTEGIKNTSQIISILEKRPEVTGIAPQLNFSVFFRSGSKKLNGTISGVDVEGEDRLFGIGDKVVSGEWEDLSFQKTGIVLGKVLAEKLSVGIDDPVNVLTSDGNSRNFTVVGTVETSVRAADASKAYVNIASARQIEGENYDYTSDIQINIRDRNATEAFIREIDAAIPYQTESWQTANQQLVAASELRNIIAMAVSLTILLVAGFGIYNIMNMTINEKIKEIAILKAMGFSGKDVRNIFLMQAFIIGIIGGLTGLLLGFGISSLVHRIPFRIAGFDTLPIVYQSIDFILAVVFGIVTTILAGYLPSRKASRIDPVVIIRG